MKTTGSKPIEERVANLETDIEELHDAVAELRADYFGRMADEDEKPKRIDMSPAYGKTGGLVFHPLDHVKE